MSEPTLYRDAKRFGKLPTEPGAELRWVVPVVPCKHGKIDPHDVPVDVPGVNKPLYDWCEGAGIGGSDE